MLEFEGYSLLDQIKWLMTKDFIEVTSYQFTKTQTRILTTKLSITFSFYIKKIIQPVNNLKLTHITTIVVKKHKLE